MGGGGKTKKETIEQRQSDKRDGVYGGKDLRKRYLLSFEWKKSRTVGVMDSDSGDDGTAKYVLYTAVVDNTSVILTNLNYFRQLNNIHKIHILIKQQLCQITVNQAESQNTFFYFLLKNKFQPFVNSQNCVHKNALSSHPISST